MSNLVLTISLVLQPGRKPLRNLLIRIDFILECSIVLVYARPTSDEAINTVQIHKPHLITC